MRNSGLVKSIADKAGAFFIYWMKKIGSIPDNARRLPDEPIKLSTLPSNNRQEANAIQTQIAQCYNLGLGELFFQCSGSKF
jgi:hypothetical protein